MGEVRDLQRRESVRAITGVPGEAGRCQAAARHTRNDQERLARHVRPSLDLQTPPPTKSAEGSGGVLQGSEVVARIIVVGFSHAST